MLPVPGLAAVGPPTNWERRDGRSRETAPRGASEQAAAGGSLHHIDTSATLREVGDTMTDRITPEALRTVGGAEQVLRDLGLRQVRVRHHGDTARIEVVPEDLPTVVSPGNRTRIVTALKELGYLYVTVDLEGYRTGSMNAPLARGREGSGQDRDG